MYKDLKFTMSTTVTVEDYDEAIAKMTLYGLSWEEFGDAVHAGLLNEVFGRDEHSKDTMYIYCVSPRAIYYFDAKVESELFEEVAEIKFEVTNPHSMKVDDGR